ncbi:patatin-like phospholipase family protein [Bosea sp. (in: a-proteobacteria)]|uniref:patatin-like phospholipase family protein n=1 Tax=Bosea sp. (in: a-proteobacteria) TaxID=1871050 RepID=UPI002FC74BA5
MFAGLAYAGGGNRCYWQGGFHETVAPRLDLKPRRVVGASAGAFAMLYTALAWVRPCASWCAKPASAGARRWTGRPSAGAAASSRSANSTNPCWLCY